MGEEKKKYRDMPPNEFSGSIGIGSYFAGQMTPDEYNSKKRDEIEKRFTAWNAQVEKDIKIAKVNNGYLPPEIFDELVTSRKSYLSNLIDKLADNHKAAPDGRLPNEQQAKILDVQAFCNFNELVDQDVKKKHRAAHPNENGETLDSQVEKAEIVSKLATPPSNGKSIFTTIRKTVYDEDKDGFQWGGIIGAIGGLMLGNSIGGGFNGGVIGVVMMVVATVIGGFLGKGAAEAMTSPTPTTSAKPEEKRGKGKSLEQENPPVEVKVDVDMEKKYSHMQSSTDSLGTLSRPTTPVSGIKMAQVAQQQSK